MSVCQPKSLQSEKVWQLARDNGHRLTHLTQVICLQIQKNLPKANRKHCYNKTTSTKLKTMLKICKYMVYTKSTFISLCFCFLLNIVSWLSRRKELGSTEIPMCTKNFTTCLRTFMCTSWGPYRELFTS